MDRFIPNRSAMDFNLDRFIPNRSAMDFDYARYVLTGGKVESEEDGSCPSKHSYRKHLAETLNLNRTRILAFKNNPPQSAKNIHEPFPSAPKTVKSRRDIPTSSESGFYVPGVLDTFYLNVLDWSSTNVVAVALGNRVYFWDASDGSPRELLSNDVNGPVTSVKWSLDGKHLAVGFDDSHVQLWDSSSVRLLRTLHGGHRSSRVASLDWNDQILTSGGMDGLIVNNDIRIRSHIVSRYRAHSQEICGLKWCSSGRYLASGGSDNLVHIWSASMAASNAPNRWLHRFDDHSAAVKALSWCPFQSNLLASGGGSKDGCIKFWNTSNGNCMNSICTGSQICSLVWSTNEREILSAHGFYDNQIALWKYPSMENIAKLHGHESRVLSMVKSPDGDRVASIAADETLRIWNVVGNPLRKKRRILRQEPFPNVPRIR